ncbi:Glycosyl transferase, family 25 [Cordyceps javanica]|uniref:Glycosyl transferase, family 25 n=1 Tax=Cordyceps javanica TaxID=43265 RepID=A0A545UMV2_9HYPO|nr:Glycosyl transferase, family 25 [Cordyceps javanica]
MMHLGLSLTQPAVLIRLPSSCSRVSPVTNILGLLFQDARPTYIICIADFTKITRFLAVLEFTRFHEMADRCGYDCAKPPTTVSPNADISGIGVVTGYVAAAGLAIVIIVVSFLFAFDPAEDPFQNRTRVQSPTRASAFRPNPVDVVVLGSFRRRVLEPRFKDAALKCVLAMSDLQILTGYSILISGYLQLYCGLSAYHWQMLVYLAWFSSLTHLSCLTFLRSYLYHRRVERTWRLIAMGLLVAMLVFALIPTGNYSWKSDASIDDTQMFASDQKSGPGRHFAVPMSRRFILAILAAVGFVWILLQSHRIQPVTDRARALYRNNILDNINNSTLGFEKIYVMGLASRTDRRDGMALQAALSDLSIEFIDGPAGENISEKAIPTGEDGKHLTGGELGCWRGHINALQEIVRLNVTSALILEDDSDWDVRIRTIMQDLAISTQALTQPLAGSSSSYADSTYPTNEEKQNATVGEFDINALPRTVTPKISPYGDEWEMMWVGHCGMRFPAADEGLPMGRVVHKDDPTVPPSGLWTLAPQPFQLYEDYPKRTRVVSHVSSGVCSLGYAVTQKGARGLLREIGLREVSSPLDLLLGYYCMGTNGRRKHNCIAPQPSIFNHHRPVGRKSANSNIGNHGDEYQSEPHTDMVQWSVRLNADAIMDGKTEFTDAFT